MTTEQQLGEIAQTLKEIHAQGGTNFALHHLIDFFVILFADIGAAVFALVTFDSWRERDRESKARATVLLAALGPFTKDLLARLPPIVERMRKAPNTGFGMPWGEGSPTRVAFADPYLAPGALAWEYPGGHDLEVKFSVVKGSISHMGTSASGADAEVVEGILKMLKVLDASREEQLDTYVRGKTRRTWRRFFGWALCSRKSRD